MTRNGYNLNDNQNFNNYSLKNKYPEQLNVDNLKHKNHDVESGKQLKVKFKLSKLLFRKNKKKTNTTADNSKKDVKITEHLMEIPEVCSKLGTNLVTGLDEKEAAMRLARDGPNAFTPPKQTPWWILYLKEMVSGFALLLWAATIGTFIAYGMSSSDPTNLYVAIILIIVIISSGTFAYYQQARSSSVFKSFKKMAPQQTTVIREGKTRQISAADIVVGDLVYCKSGETVPADIRIIKSESMKVDNSSLTGESDPLTRSPDIGHENPLEARNVAFFSTYCVDGNGFGIAIATGDRTVMGEIARLVTNIKNEETPLAIEISRFVKIITIIALTEGIIFFIICMAAFKQDFFTAFMFFIGIVIGNVPEGLLPALSVALTVTAKRMASKNCMVKNLQAVETLGSTSVICSDKTGTLTQNRMTVEHCWMGSDIFKVSHNREQVKQQMSSVIKCWDAYKRCAILCSRSEFTNNDPDVMKRECNGDASETAILRFMESVEGPVAQYRSKFPKVAERPFSSTTKYQFSIHHNTEVNTHSVNGSMSNFFLVMKGAPERIIKMCKYYVKDDGTTAQIDDAFNQGFEDSYRELGSMGERVLALCDHDFTQLPADYKFNLEDGNDFQLSNFRFLGLVAMIDPPRPTVPGAVEKCRRAGIKVVMVTGDHPITAQAIARQVGIISNSHRKSTSIRFLTIDKIEKNTRSVVVPGDELSDMSDTELKEIISGFGEIVFARTSPQQKLRIVTNFQELGQIVAVTGDGVNDSPALKKADIGIAMGITGSEVSKQAADMILMDDNFATIVIGVEEGRRIFDNMKKAILYIGSVNVTTIYPYIIYLIFGLPLPIGTITVLLICLGINIAPAVALAYEKAESDIMDLKPRNPKKDKLVTIELLCRIYLLLGVIGTVMGLNGYFVYFFFEGLRPEMLWQLRTQWEDTDALVLKYGPNDSHWGKPTQLIDFDTRSQLILRAQSSYFISIALMSAITVICCKTRRLSIFSQGMGNWTLNYCIIITTGLSALVVYCPGLSLVLQQSTVIGQIWVTTIPFIVYIFLFEEISKLIVRSYPASFLAKELLF